MVRDTGLSEVKPSLSLVQKMSGGVMAEMWSRSDDPPLGADKSGYYAAALAAGVAGEARTRIARCLLWSDFIASQYSRDRLEWYAQSVLAYPDDERSVFFVAFLCLRKVIQDPSLVAFTYHRVLDPRWERSPFWKRFVLPQKAILRDVGKLYAADLENILPERVDLVERALAGAEDRVSEKKPLAVYLARAYGQAGRDDEDAEVVYRYVFTCEPDDQTNNSLLARLYLQRQRADADACAVYNRMVGQCDRLGNEAEANYWALRLAQAYLNVGRVDEGALAAYRRANHVAPEDQDLRAALLCALARRRTEEINPETIKLLEEAMDDEATLASRFAARRWDWSLVIRALGYAYGMQGRLDDEARAVYRRATEMCPEERDIWVYLARGLALESDFSHEAMEIYERATRTHGSDEVISVALARAYVRNGAYEGLRRERAMKLWEELYRQGIYWPDMIHALAQAYAAEDRVNDIALELWEQSSANDEKNGSIRLRMAQEYRSRSDWALAAKYYREAAKILTKDFTAQYEAGVLLLNHFSDYATGIRLLQKAVKLPAGQMHLAAHFALGEALLAREKREEARAIFQKIIETIDANHTPTLLHLAKLSLKYEEESVKQAEALYEQVKTVDPDQPETYRRMADLYHERGQFEEEEKALEKFLALSEPDAPRLQQLAELYLRRGDFVRAEQMLRRVIAMSEGDKRLYTLLGEVILQAQRQAKADAGPAGVSGGNGPDQKA